MRRILPLLAVLPLSACGGDGSGSSGPPPIPTLNVTISPASQAIKATEDASETSFSFDATQSGSTSDPVYPDLQYDKTLFVLQGNPTLTNGKYVVAFKTLNGLGGDSYKGSMTFRLCKDTGCGTVYPGSTQNFSYTLDVQLKDWETLQRNAAHTGYVHASFDPANFKKAWEWLAANTVELSPVATRGTTAFVTRRNQDGTTSVQAVSTVSGAEAWSYNVGSVSSASTPAVGGNQLYISSMVSSSGNNKNIVLNASTGQFVRSMDFAAQWSYFAPPTTFATEVYTASGYYGNIVYGYNGVTGATLWTANGKGGNIWDGETPAVDSEYVYYYSGASLDIFDRMTGAFVKSITDPFFAWAGYSYRGGPILGSKNNVVAYSGAYVGASGGGVGQPKPLVNYSVASGAYAWRTADVYETIPGLAKGVVYVARNNATHLDAVNEDTGAVLWTWAPPAGESFLGNAIVTDTLVFVSTDKAVYAVSTSGTTHSSVWTAATPGSLTISSDGRLIVTSPAGGSSKLTAYTLR